MKKITRWVALICFLFLCFPRLHVNADSSGYLIKFQNEYVPDIVKYELKEINAKRGIYSTESLELLRPIEKYIQYIAPNKTVSLIEGEETITPFTVPQEELYLEQWHLQLIHADAGWNLESYGNDIRVAVIDSGCYEHEDLKNNLLEGKNYLTGSNDVTDHSGHGTHVSGIIAAEMNGFGIVGVAPRAKIVPLKCFDPSQETYVDNLLDAIYDAVDVYECEIINMSWGLKTNDPFLKEAIDYAYDKGVILIAAVGNYGNTTMYYPSAYENVIGVSSVTQSKRKSSFAQKNKSVMVMASGENVQSTFLNNAYQSMKGTSQAAPMISGIAAMALSMNEKLTNEQFKQLLIDTAEDLGDTGYDTTFGYGLANEDAMVNKLLESMPFYVSPINTGEEDAYVLIKNNTKNVLEAVSIFSEYENQKFVKCRQTQITLLPGSEITIKTENHQSKIAHFLWSRSGNLAPLTQKRERE